MRYLPLLLSVCIIAASCSAPQGKLHGIDSVSPEGEPLRTYSQVTMRTPAADHDLLISMSKLVLLGKGDDQVVLADDLAVVFKARNGKVGAEMKAGTLFYHPAAQLMEFGGGVLWDVQTMGDLQMELGSVSWDMTSNHFLGEGGVRLFGSESIIEGESIVFDFFLNAYRIESVAGVYKYDQVPAE